MKKPKKLERATQMEQIPWKWVAAVLPYYYGTNRTACQVHYIDGKYEVVYASCERTMEHWMKYFGTTLKAVKEVSGQLTDSKRRLPLIVNESKGIVPVKAREDQGGSGGTLGYFDMDAIDYIVEVENHGTILYFHEKHKGICIPQKKETVLLQWRRCKDMQRKYVMQRREQQLLEEKLLAESRKSRGLPVEELEEDAWLKKLSSSCISTV